MELGFFVVRMKLIERNDSVGAVHFLHSLFSLSLLSLHIAMGLFNIVTRNRVKE
jgi:hypothetical protein